MTDIEKLETKIELLEEKLKSHDQKIEGFADAFVIAINALKDNQGRFISLMGLIFSVLGILLIGIQIGLSFLK